MLSLHESLNLQITFVERNSMRIIVLNRNFISFYLFIKFEAQTSKF